MKTFSLLGKVPAALFLSCALLLTSCHSYRKLAGTGSFKAVSDSIWTHSLSHPDGFTLDITTMTEPAEGVIVAYAATQGSHSRKQLANVVKHAMRHDGYVGGWLDTTDSLYYFDSARLFPEDSLNAAIHFAVENEQLAVFVLSEGREIRLDTPHTSPEWTIREAKCDESLNIQPTEDTIIVKLNWWLAKAELRDFSLAHLDSVMNTLCHAGARFEITYWDYQYEYWSFIPAKMRAEYLYDRMNEVCPNSVTAVHVRYEMLKEGEKMPNHPSYKVLMICRRH
ncbi:MAG: hypothetical protein J6T13_05180 [Bacteroidales bacterium]|nr:hypothetical protein [Bacteroidales bacterium]